MTKLVIFGNVNTKYENETTNWTTVTIAPAWHSSSLCPWIQFHSMHFTPKRRNNRDFCLFKMFIIFKEHDHLGGEKTQNNNVNYLKTSNMDFICHGGLSDDARRQWTKESLIFIYDHSQTLSKISTTWNWKLCTILWLMDSEVLFSGKITGSHNNKIHILLLVWGSSISILPQHFEAVCV